MNPTPHCNSVIMSDILMEYHLSYLQETCEKFDGLKEAIRLLKVWLHQRGFDQVIDRFLLLFKSYLYFNLFSGLWSF